jgi:hypothetical protein
MKLKTSGLALRLPGPISAEAQQAIPPCDIEAVVVPEDAAPSPPRLRPRAGCPPRLAVRVILIMADNRRPA